MRSERKEKGKTNYHSEGIYVNEFRLINLDVTKHTDNLICSTLKRDVIKDTNNLICSKLKRFNTWNFSFYTFKLKF